jgi:hypothetical protein
MKRGPKSKDFRKDYEYIIDKFLSSGMICDRIYSAQTNFTNDEKHTSWYFNKIIHSIGYDKKVHCKNVYGLPYIYRV